MSITKDLLNHYKFENRGFRSTICSAQVGIPDNKGGRMDEAFAYVQSVDTFDSPKDNASLQEKYELLCKIRTLMSRTTIRSKEMDDEFEVIEKCIEDKKTLLSKTLIQ